MRDASNELQKKSAIIEELEPKYHAGGELHTDKGRRF